jgi:hypothetical protein
MRTSVVLAVLLATLIAALALHAQAPMPRCTTVDPATGKIGDEVTVTGENLDKANVAELRLAPSTGGNEVKVVISEQTATTIKFKVPTAVKPGRHALVTVSKRIPRDLEIEQPVKLTIE